VAALRHADLVVADPVTCSAALSQEQCFSVAGTMLCTHYAQYMARQAQTHRRLCDRPSLKWSVDQVFDEARLLAIESTTVINIASGLEVFAR
jgi:hypothetical protein